MLSIFMLLLGLSSFNSVNLTTPGLLTNSFDAIISESDNPRLKHDRFSDDIISSINTDNAKNELMLHFREGESDSIVNGKNKVVLDKNFMRFGRGESAFMRFGKRQIESMVSELGYQRQSNENNRDSRGDNFMRFGRSKDKLVRLGRSSDCSMLTFGHANGNDRSETSLMQPRCADSFMRLGKRPLFGSVKDNTHKHQSILLYRIGRDDKNFMRFGKLDQNFMRFGKRHKNTDREEDEYNKHEVSTDRIDTTLKAVRI